MLVAAREFICVRPQSYEDREEAEWLKSLFRGSALPNTVFCLLAPDGKKALTRSGRSPAQIFDHEDAFAEFMEDAFEPYAAKAKPIAALPRLNELPLALNVAACDSLPLVVLRASSQAKLAALEKTVASLAWSEALRGKAHYFAFVGKEPKEGESGSGFVGKGGKALELDVSLKEGVTILDPGEFGVSPNELGHISSSAKAAKVAKALERALGAHDPEEKSRRRHMRLARDKGLSWDSELEVTDPSSNRRRRR